MAVDLSLPRDWRTNFEVRGPAKSCKSDPSERMRVVGVGVAKMEEIQEIQDVREDARGKQRASLPQVIKATPDPQQKEAASHGLVNSPKSSGFEQDCMNVG